MPTKRTGKHGVLESLIEKEVYKSVKSIIKKSKLATSRDLKSVVVELRSLRKQLGLRKKSKLVKVKVGRKPTHVTCTVRGCNKPHYAKGLCATHYQKRRREEARAAKTATRRGPKKTAAVKTETRRPRKKTTVTAKAKTSKPRKKTVAKRRTKRK